jgi:pimeloyl-ACP methyl ester carboxylesterase
VRGIRFAGRIDSLHTATVHSRPACHVRPFPLVYGAGQQLRAGDGRSPASPDRGYALWYFRETGSGPPLVLLHGIGMSNAAWSAVTPYLESTRRVIAFDIAGFGSTPALPGGTPPTVPNLVDALDRSIRDVGLEIPVDLAGNSLGGTMALEAATRGIARTVVAISPACLWRKHGAAHVPIVFQGLRVMAGHFPGLLRTVVQNPWLRELALAVPISVGSRRMHPDDACRAVDDLARATAFEATFASTRSPFSAHAIAVPVTVAFGDRDWILTKGSRLKSALPAHARWVEKRGWGHSPMWVDPAGVAELILEGTRFDASSGVRPGSDPTEEPDPASRHPLPDRTGRALAAALRCPPARCGS